MLSWVAARQRRIIVEACWLGAASYMFQVSAQWQGYGSPNFTINYGAIVTALLIDGGLWVCLHLFNLFLFRKEWWALLWALGVVVCALLSFHNNVLYLSTDYQVNTSALATLGLSKFQEDMIKAITPVFFMVLLAFVPPVKVEIDEQAEEDAHRRKLRKAREKQELRALSAGNLVDTFKVFGSALSSGQKAEQTLMLQLRAELRKLGVAETGESDAEVKLRATEAGIYDPATNVFKPRPQPKPVKPPESRPEPGDTAPLPGVSDAQEEFFSAKQIQERTGWSPRTIRHRMEDGWSGDPEYKIHPYKGRKKLPGTGRYVDRAEMERLLRIAARDAGLHSNGHQGTEPDPAAVFSSPAMPLPAEEASPN